MFRRLAIGDMLYVALPGNKAAVVLQYFVNHNSNQLYYSEFPCVAQLFVFLRHLRLYAGAEGKQISGG